MSSIRLRNSGRKWARSASSRIRFSSPGAAGGGACAPRDEFAPDVRRHDDDGVLEVDRAPLAVGQPAVVEHLKERRPDVRVRLLDLVEEDDGIGVTADGLGQLAPLLVSDVPRRGADHPGDGVLLLVLGHVEADHRVLVVEEEIGQSARELRLSDARGPEEEERADRALRVLHPRPGAPDGGGDGVHGLVLPDDAPPQAFVHLQELLRLPLDHLRHGDSGPLRDDLGDVLLVHLLAEDGAPLLELLETGRGGVQILLELQERAVAKLGRPAQVSPALGLLGGHLRLVDRLLQSADRRKGVLFRLPARLHRAGALLHLGERLLDGPEALLRGARVVLLQGLLLDLGLEDPPLHLVDLGRKRVDLHLQLRGRLVDEVDGLVGEEAVGDVAVREGGRRDEGGVGDLDAVVQLVPFREAAKDGDRVLDRGLADEDRLEPALEGGVLLDVLAVLADGRRADGSAARPARGRASACFRRPSPLRPRRPR